MVPVGYVGIDVMLGRMRSAMARHGALCTLAFVACVFVALTYGYALMRCANFHCSMIDLGSFYQVVDAMASGAAPIMESQPPYVPQHWFGIHFSPILYALVPAYWLWPSPLVLQLAQSVLVASACWPLFLCGRALGFSPKSSAVLASMLLINPYIIAGAIWDFHEVAFAVPLFAWGLWAVLQKRFALLCVACALLVLTKEHYGAAVFGFGLLWAAQHRDVMRGASLAAAGLLAFGLIVGVIMPHYTGGNLAAFSEDSLGDYRYGWIKKVLHGEMNVLRATLAVIVPLGIVYVSALMLPFVFTPILAIAWLLPAGADVAVNLLSSSILPRSLVGYHSMPIIPILLVAAAVCIAKRQIKLRWYFVLPSLVWCAFYFTHMHGPGYWQIKHRGLTLPQTDQQIVARISDYIEMRPDARLAVQNNLGVHMAVDAKRLTRFPHPSLPADIIVVYLNFPFDQHTDKIGTVYNIQPKQFYDALTAALGSPDYQIVMASGPWLLLARSPAKRIESAADSATRARIIARMDALRMLDKRLNVLDEQNPPGLFF